MRRNKKSMVKARSMKVKTYNVLSRAVEEGVRYGYNRAFKHCEAPGEKEICNSVYDGIMNELNDWFTFGDEGDGE
jgi:hypothetical protein